MLRRPAPFGQRLAGIEQLQQQYGAGTPLQARVRAHYTLWRCNFRSISGARPICLVTHGPAVEPQHHGIAAGVALTQRHVVIQVAADRYSGEGPVV